MTDTAPDPLNLVDLLDRLVEPGDPPPVSMAPQTWGWAALAALLAIAAIILTVHLVRRYRANAYRREALAEMRRSPEDPAAIARILRRTALAAYPRRDVAGLTGERWLAFLNRTGRASHFEGEAGRNLIRAPYRDTPPGADMKACAEQWIRSHQREAGP